MRGARINIAAQSNFPHRGAMLRSFSLLAALGLAIRPGPAAAAPLQPTGKWQVDYTATSCTAKRAFGDHAIAIVPSPLGESTRIIIEGPGRATHARQHKSMIDPVDGRDAIKASSLIYPLKTKGRRGIYSVVPNEVVARMLGSGKVEVRAGGVLDNRILWDNRIASGMGAALEIGGGVALSKAIETCMGDLRNHWGMVDGKLPAPALASQSQHDVRGIFRSDDYPADAVEAGQGGATSYLLMIDERGAVMDCAIKQSSGVATLDAMGCQVIRERAKFAAAKDGTNKPVKSTYVTPVIRWVIE